MMTDREIEELLSVPKYIQNKDRKKMNLAPSESVPFVRFNIELEAQSDFKFFLYGRLSSDDPTDFSAILKAVNRKTAFDANLLRCNGSAHEHRNKLEKNLVSGTHIHKVTERYLETMRFPPEGFAESTDEYSNFDGALECLMKMANIHIKTDEAQIALPFDTER